MIDGSRAGAIVDGRAEFSAFMRDASPGLQRTAWLLTGDWSLAEDLVQTALVKTWRRWARIDPAAAHGYVRRVLMTTFLAWRSRKWTGELSTDRLPDVVASQDVYQQIDLRRALQAALLDLPRQQRAVVVLRYFDDLTEVGTAAVLGCSVGTVKSHASRALNALRAVPELDPAPDRRRT
jgi:RNA polymerase sigma-70 factor (sigma-E family)